VAGSSGEAPCPESTAEHASGLQAEAAEIQSANALGSSGEAPCEAIPTAVDEAPEHAGAEIPEKADSSGEAPLDIDGDAQHPTTESGKADSSGEAPFDIDAQAQSSPSATAQGDMGPRLDGGGSGEAPLQAEDTIEHAEAAPESTPQDAASAVEVQIEARTAPVEAGADQAGGSGEAPLREGSHAGEADESSRAQQPSQEAMLEVAGDYHWCANEDKVECVLRLMPSGQWWHAAHRSSTERGRIVDPKARTNKDEKAVDIRKAYKNFDYEEDEAADLTKLGGDFEEFQVWEIAETLGSWQHVQISSETMSSTGAEPLPGVLLKCENCSWKTNFPNAPLVYHPSKDCEDEVDAMLEAGQPVLCFVRRTCDETGNKSLELHMDLSTVSDSAGAKLQDAPTQTRLRSLQTAFQTFGFTRAYKEGQPPKSSGSQPSASSKLECTS
jgi:hypothetical protein